jgi:hypothetical protein
MVTLYGHVEPQLIVGVPSRSHFEVGSPSFKSERKRSILARSVTSPPPVHLPGTQGRLFLFDD